MCRCDECNEARAAFLKAFEAMEVFIANNNDVFSLVGFKEFRDEMSVAMKVFHKKNKNKVEMLKIIEHPMHPIMAEKLNELIGFVNDIKEKIDSGKMQ